MSEEEDFLSEPVSVIVDLLQSSGLDYEDLKNVIVRIKKEFLKRISVRDIKTVETLFQKMGYEWRHSFQEDFEKKYRFTINEINGFVSYRGIKFEEKIYNGKFMLVEVADRIIVVEILEDKDKIAFKFHRDKLYTLKDARKHLEHLNRQ